MKISKSKIIKKNKLKNKNIAKEHILKLFDLAKNIKENKSQQISLKKRYITLAEKYSQKYKTPIPRNLKRSYCKNCKILLIVGKTSKIRIKPGKNNTQIITCQNCKTIKRIVLSKK